MENGRNIAVSVANRQEFVQRRIEFEFQEQCKSQLEAFKKGFWRLIDREVLLEILTPDDLEQLICGQRTLDFNEL